MNKILFFNKHIFLILLICLPLISFAQTTQLRDDFCGSTLNALGTNIFADNVSGATAYRFRIVNQATSVVTIFDSSNRWFNLIGAGAGPVNNETYEVEVAVNMGSGFGIYGSMCLVNTPVVTNPTSQLRADFCNQTIASLGSNIFADNVLEAVAYRFRIVKLATNETFIYDSPNRWFNLIGIGAAPEINETYEVDVALDLGSGFEAFGTLCTVQTPSPAPAITQVRADFCGATIDALGSNIFLDNVELSVAYRIRIFNVNSGETTLFITTNPWFNLVNAGASPIFNESYNVDVAVDMGSGFGEYGAICTVFTPVVATPTTQLRADFCGATLSALGTNIFADLVTGAVTYRFRMHNLSTGVTTIFDSPNRWFNLVNAGASPQFNETFQIDVAVNIGAGFGSYGAVCNVNTPVVVTPTTQIRNDFCNNYIAALGSNIFADNVIGATGYRFRITNVITNVTVIHDRPNRWFNLINAGAAPQIAQQFSIDVAVNIGSGFGAYGPACFVFTPHIAPTQIEAADCGTTKEMLFYEYFHAIPSAQAEMYQFRIRNGSFQSLSEETDEPLTRFFEFSEYAYGATYDVDVRIMFNGVWGPFGPSCQISTIDEPYTQIQTDQFGGAIYCGATVPSVTSRIYAYGIPLITAYRFRVSRNDYVDSIETIVRDFKLSDLPNFASNIEYGVPYNVEVALEFNGTFTEYGVICQVFTPSPITQLRADFCGATLTSNGQNIFADAVPGAQQYRFEIDNGSGITIFTANNRWFNLINAGVAAPNTLYTIRVAIGVNGNFYEFGAPCTVQTPTGMMAENLGIQEANTDEHFEIQSNSTTSALDKPTLSARLDAVLFPNPSNGAFQINLSGLSSHEIVDISIFDATGAQVHHEQLSSELAKTKKFNLQLTTGIYFVRLESNKQVKTLKLLVNN